MTSLRSLLDAGDARFRRAAGLFASAALVALVPLAGIAYVLVRAANGPPDRGTVVLFTFVVLASAAVQLPLAAAGSRLLRSILDERAERARVDVVEHLRLVPARTLAAIDPGQVLATMTLGLDQAVAVVNGAFDSIFGGLFKAAGCIAIVAAIDWRIALVSVAFLPVTVGYLRRSRTSSSRAMTYDLDVVWMAFTASRILSRLSCDTCALRNTSASMPSSFAAVATPSP